MFVSKKKRKITILIHCGARPALPNASGYAADALTYEKSALQRIAERHCDAVASQVL